MFDQRPIFDEKDQEILDKCLENRRKLSGPLVGDWVIMEDGSFQRFAHDWGPDIQTCNSGSFYLFSGGGASMSGGLNPAVDKKLIRDTGMTKPAEFWFFHHGSSGANRGVYFNVMCPVYAMAASVNEEWGRF